jgi:hypothetical protein
MPGLMVLVSVSSLVTVPIHDGLLYMSAWLGYGAVVWSDTQRTVFMEVLSRHDSYFQVPYSI